MCERCEETSAYGGVLQWRCVQGVLRSVDLHSVALLVVWSFSARSGRSMTIAMHQLRINLAVAVSQNDEALVMHWQA